jgi:hypothetical protein
MIDNTVSFWINKRTNKYAKKGYEWAFNMQIGHGFAHTICTFDLIPTENLINQTKEIILRTMEVYHAHLKIPAFKMKEIQNDEN